MSQQPSFFKPLLEYSKRVEDLIKHSDEIVVRLKRHESIQFSELIKAMEDSQSYLLEAKHTIKLARQLEKEVRTMTKHRNWLGFNRDNTVLSCGCGANTYTIAAWNAMTEHQRDEAKAKAHRCPTCIKDHDK